jgi:hypothetical protein
MQSLPAPHAWPATFLQPPEPSHAFTPVHAPAGTVSGEPKATNVEQVPAAFAHDLHGVVQVSTQQVPSMQLPVRQSVPAAHACPDTFRQLAAPFAWPSQA